MPVPTGAASQPTHSAGCGLTAAENNCCARGWLVKATTAYKRNRAGSTALTVCRRHRIQYVSLVNGRGKIRRLSSVGPDLCSNISMSLSTVNTNSLLPKQVWLRNMESLYICAVSKILFAVLLLVLVQQGSELTRTKNLPCLLNQLLTAPAAFKLSKGCPKS